MPNIGPLGQTSIPQDIASRTLQAIREALHGRTQKRDILGRIPTPTYEEQRQKNLRLLHGYGFVVKPLGATGDWTRGGFPSIDKTGKDGEYFGGPEVDTPEQRTDRGLYIYILDGKDAGDSVKLPFVPQELDYTPSSNFEAISAMGRNNPLYHYTGSEDILKFTIDWFAQQEGREDVILNCKLLESLSKNDGFENPPSRVKLIWHNSLFSNATWIVAAAPYKLSMFQAHRNMMPQQAYQEVTLKRVAEFNPGISDVRDANF